MNFLEYFHSKTLKYDLLNKFYYNKIKNIPKLKKIILNFGCNTTKIKILSSSLLALELITSKKGQLTTSNKSNILLKIRKGNPVGCKIVLRNKHMFNFLEYSICCVFPEIKNFTGFRINKKFKQKKFSFNITDTFNFKELESNYYLFNELTKLNVTMVFESKLGEEINFMLNSFQLPLQKLK